MRVFERTFLPRILQLSCPCFRLLQQTVKPYKDDARLVVLVVNALNAYQAQFWMLRLAVIWQVNLLSLSRVLNGQSIQIVANEKP